MPSPLSDTIFVLLELKDLEFVLSTPQNGMLGRLSLSWLTWDLCNINNEVSSCQHFRVCRAWD